MTVIAFLKSMRNFTTISNSFLRPINIIGFITLCLFCICSGCTNAAKSGIVEPKVILVSEFKRVVTNDISFVKEDFFIPSMSNPFMSIEHNAIGRHIYSFYSCTGAELVRVHLYDYMDYIHIEETDFRWNSLVGIWENNIESVMCKNKEGDTFEVLIDKEDPSKIEVKYNSTVYRNYRLFEIESGEETLPPPDVTAIDSILGRY